MKKIPFTSINLYEFQCEDEGLIDRVLEEVKGPDMKWTDHHDGSVKFMSHGYREKEGKKVGYYNEELFNWVHKCVDEVTQIHFPGRKLAICDSWVNRSKYQELAHKHLHTFSILSGCLYLTSHNNSKTRYVYTDPWLEHFRMFDEVGPHVNNVTITPEKGKLILFRSDILHSVDPHSEVNTTRYSFAFNTFFDGIVSEIPTSRLKVNLERM